MAGNDERNKCVFAIGRIRKWYGGSGRPVSTGLYPHPTLSQPASPHPEKARKGRLAGRSRGLPSLLDHPSRRRCAAPQDEGLWVGGAVSDTLSPHPEEARKGRLEGCSRGLLSLPDHPSRGRLRLLLADEGRGGLTVRPRHQASISSRSISSSSQRLFGVRDLAGRPLPAAPSPWRTALDRACRDRLPSRR